MILIIAAMEDEVKDLINEYELIDDTYFSIYKSKNSKKDVLLTISGIGKVNAGSALTYVLTKYNDIELIVNIGIAGGHKIQPNQFYLVDQAKYHDVDLTHFGYKHGQLPKEDEYFMINHEYMDKFLNLPKMKLYSGDQFSTTKIDDTAYLVDMEGASLVHISKRFKKPILLFKKVSDVIGSINQLDSYKENEKTASLSILEFINEVLEVLLWKD